MKKSVMTKIEELRIDTGLTRAELAHKAGIQLKKVKAAEEGQEILYSEYQKIGRALRVQVPTIALKTVYHGILPRKRKFGPRER